MYICIYISIYIYICTYIYISYHVISYHIMSCHIMSNHIISYHVISYHIISYLYLSTCVCHHCFHSALMPSFSAGRGDVQKLGVHSRLFDPETILKPLTILKDNSYDISNDIEVLGSNPLDFIGRLNPRLTQGPWPFGLLCFHSVVHGSPTPCLV